MVMKSRAMEKAEQTLERAGEPGLIRKRQSRAVVEPPPPHPRTHYVSLPRILSVQGLPPSIPIHDLAPLPAHP